MRTLIVFLALFLPGCTTQSTNYAGISDYQFEITADGIRTARIINGKEYETVKATYEKSNDYITLTFESQDTRAFEGQAISAEVQTAIANTISNTLEILLPEIIATTIKASKGTP